MVEINKAKFRTDLEDYFKLSGIREYKELKHTPFIVIDNGKLELCLNAKNLVENYSKDAEVLNQWRGQYRSDFFYFKIRDFIEYIKEHPKEQNEII